MNEQDSFSRTVKSEIAATKIVGKIHAFWEARAIRQAIRPHMKYDLFYSGEPFLIRRLYNLEKMSAGTNPLVRIKGKVGKRSRFRSELKIPDTREVTPVTDSLFTTPAHRRSYLRGLFLARGYVASPNKGHHLELSLASKKESIMAQQLLAEENIKTGLVQRRGCSVVYVKDAEQISEFLKLIGATGTLFEYENIRLRKNLRSSVQRIVNMDKANVIRSVEASLRQIENITLIDYEFGLAKLPPALRQLAHLRLEHPDMSMEELGEMLHPPISKSAVNHRFRRLAKLAEKIKDNTPSN